MAFLWIMATGLLGLILMAIPGMQRHGHSGAAHPLAPPSHGAIPSGAGALRAGAHLARGGARMPVTSPSTHTPGAVRQTAGEQPAISTNTGAPPPTGFQVAQLIPSPRAVFSFMAMFGAFGYALLALLPLPFAIVAALVPAWAIEKFAVSRLWNYLFQFQGTPATPIESLVLCEAQALTPFRNGKGIVAMEHDGRMVQFSAHLQPAHAAMPVDVGDKLLVEEVDAAQQRVLVSIR